MRGFALSWARVGGAWQRLGELTLTAPAAEQEGVSFDPVLHQVPGLQQYSWVERLRERSYATARRSRRASPS